MRGACTANRCLPSAACHLQVNGITLQDSRQQPVWLVDCAAYTACTAHSEQQGLVPSATLASVHAASKDATIRAVPGLFEENTGCHQTMASDMNQPAGKTFLQEYAAHTDSMSLPMCCMPPGQHISSVATMLSAVGPLPICCTLAQRLVTLVTNAKATLRCLPCAAGCLHSTP